MSRKGIFLLPFLLLTGCSKLEDKKLDIFIASDLHYLADELLSESNEVCVKEKMSGDGRVQECDEELLVSLVNKCNKERPDYLILTGDLTFQGERASHLKVSEFLSKLEYTKALVIPGNHDMYNQQAGQYIDDYKYPVSSVTSEEFREIYYNQGYSNALYLDSNSNSYIYELDKDTYAIMLDTTMCKYNEEFSTNFVSGFVEDETFNWLRKCLEELDDGTNKFISASHHNLSIHHPLFYDYYTLANADALLELYKKHNVKINFSGHLHIQSIKEVNGLYDIASGSLLTYGNRHGSLSIYSNGYDYKAYKLDNEKIESFEKYSFDTFYSKFEKKNKDKYDKDTLDFLCRANCYYFDGDYEMLVKLTKERKFKSKIKGVLEKNAYFKYILENCKDSQNELVIIDRRN